MTLKINNLASNKTVGFLTEIRVKRLCTVIPHEDIVGLEEVLIVDNFEDKRIKNAGGYYTSRNKYETCHIALSVNSIYRDMPILIHFFPFIAVFLLARTFYHEVGHHHHKRYNYNTGNVGSEKFAEEYCNKMLKKKFKLWLLLFAPFKSLIRHLRN